MHSLRIALSVSVAAFLAMACERKIPTVVVEERRIDVLPEAKTKTLETTRLAAEVDRYAQTPSAETASAVQVAMAELDGEIAELERRLVRATGDDRAETERKIINLRQYRAAEEARFLKAKASSAIQVPAEPLPRDERNRTEEKIEDGAQRVGDKIEDAARKVGEGIKDAADAVRDSVQ